MLQGTATMVNSAQQAYLFYGIGWLAREFLWIRLGVATPVLKQMVFLKCLSSKTNKNKSA
jgi:hypothetical protein